MRAPPAFSFAVASFIALCDLVACAATSSAPTAAPPVRLASTTSAPAAELPPSPAPIASVAPSPSATEPPWYFGVNGVVSIDPANPCPPRFRPLRSGMTPTEVGAVFPGGEKLRAAAERDGGADAVSEVEATTDDGVISYSFAFRKTNGKLGLTSATMHFSQARMTTSFRAELLRALRMSLGTPSAEDPAFVAWSSGSMIDAGDHYAFRWAFAPMAALRLRGQ